MIKYFTIEDLLKHYLQKKFHILKKFGRKLRIPLSVQFRIKRTQTESEWSCLIIMYFRF